MTDFKTTNTNFLSTTGDDLFAVHSLDVSTEYLDLLKAQRGTQDALSKMPEMLLAASVPAIVADKWAREGFFPENEPPAKLIAKLKAEGLDAFIMTGKNL